MCVKVVKTFFSLPVIISSSQNLYQELGYVPHCGSLLIVWAVRMLHAVGICADIMVVRLCAAHTLVCTCAHVYALPCELAYRCSSPLPPLFFESRGYTLCHSMHTPLSISVGKLLQTHVRPDSFRSNASPRVHVRANTPGARLHLQCL